MLQCLFNIQCDEKANKMQQNINNHHDMESIHTSTPSTSITSSSSLSTSGGSSPFPSIQQSKMKKYDLRADDYLTNHNLNISMNKKLRPPPTHRYNQISATPHDEEEEENDKHIAQPIHYAQYVNHRSSHLYYTIVNGNC
eukprot:392750_1